MPRPSRFSSLPIALLLLAVLVILPGSGSATIENDGPPLSNIALLSRFARENGLAPASVESASADFTPSDRSTAGAEITGAGVEVRVNQDFSFAPQNEVSVAVNPWSPNMILAGANDYRLGVPVGAAFYTSFDGGSSWTDGIPPFPLLAGPVDESDLSARGGQFTEPPRGTGDPVVGFGQARPGSPALFPGLPVAYLAYLGVSASFCEHGIFVSRSANGLTWARPAVPSLYPRRGLFTPVYWDQTEDCSVFNDKPWMAVDQTGGPHNGRVYVTWSRFVYDEGDFRQSTIEMAYSDDNAETWSRPLNVSGVSHDYCPAQVSGPAGRCDESQFSTAMVAPDGTLYIAFINQQAKGAEDGFRNQYLVTSVNPDTLERAGPYRAATMIDGDFDFPVSVQGRATLCNSNFRLNTAGNLAVDPSDPTGKTLYIVFTDNRNGSSFPNRTQVTQQPPDSFACPPDKTTDTDVFIVRSTDGGQQWKNPATDQAEPLRINQDDLANGKDQWFPFVAVGADGALAVVFHDRREDFFNRLGNVYLARSADHGATWTDERINTTPSNLNWAFESGIFIGDYEGVAIAPDGTTYAAWTDSRNGTTSVRQSDIYMAIVPPS